jgi:hypothetical protein
VALSDRLREPDRPSQGPTCTLRRVLALLAEESPDEHAALRAALADRRYTGRQIAAALRAEGFEVSSITVNRHRRRECACPR